MWGPVIAMGTYKLYFADPKSRVRIEALVLNVPYGMPSGWGKKE
jgi:hypothetical protein